MVNGPFVAVYSRASDSYKVVDKNIQTIAVINAQLPVPCQETMAEVIAKALNQFLKIKA